MAEKNPYLTPVKTRNPPKPENHQHEPDGMSWEAAKATPYGSYYPTPSKYEDVEDEPYSITHQDRLDIMSWIPEPSEPAQNYQSPSKTEAVESKSHSKPHQHHLDGMSWSPEPSESTQEPRSPPKTAPVKERHTVSRALIVEQALAWRRAVRESETLSSSDKATLTSLGLRTVLVRITRLNADIVSFSDWDCDDYDDFKDLMCLVCELKTVVVEIGKCYTIYDALQKPERIILFRYFSFGLGLLEDVKERHWGRNLIDL